MFIVVFPEGLLAAAVQTCPDENILWIPNYMFIEESTSLIHAIRK